MAGEFSSKSSIFSTTSAVFASASGTSENSSVHFLLCFKPLLFCIAHSVWVVHIFAGVQANKQIVGIGIFGIGKMHIVGGY
jgi:hypothetical protein